MKRAISVLGFCFWAGTCLAASWLPLARNTDPNANFFVSGSSLASDSNNCTAKATPCATIGHAISLVSSTANQTIAIERGWQYRESGLTVASNGLSLTVYGSGGAPQILGSTKIASSWTLVSGTEYSTPLAYTNRTAFRVVGVSITKLSPGTAGSLSANQFFASGSQLNVNIGMNPTGQDIEVSGNNSNPGVVCANQTNLSITGIAVMFMPFSGMAFDTCDGALVQTSVISWNGDDGIDGVNPGVVTIQNNTIQGNGYQTKGVTPSGDGISFHNNSTLHAYSNTIIDNYLTGIGSESNSNSVAAYNYIRNNYNNLFLYIGPAGVGNHYWYYNIVVDTATDNSPVTVQGPTGSAITTRIDNLTVHDEGSGAFVMVSVCDTGTTSMTNNIFSNGGGTEVYGIGNYSAGCGGGTLTVDANLYANFSADYQPGELPNTIGPNEASAATAGFTSTTPGAENFQLLTTSAAKASGNNLGYTRDQIGAPVPFVPGAPCRGALEREASFLLKRDIEPASNDNSPMWLEKAA